MSAGSDHVVALPGAAALGAVPLRLARLGLADAVRPGRGSRGAATTRRCCSRRSPTPPASPRSCSPPPDRTTACCPTPIDRTQIAYGADARVQALLAVGDATGRPGIRDLAGIAAGWFFGANPAGVPVYDPATGVTNDGVAGRRHGQPQLRRRVAPSTAC